MLIVEWNTNIRPPSDILETGRITIGGNGERRPEEWGCTAWAGQRYMFGLSRWCITDFDPARRQAQRRKASVMMAKGHVNTTGFSIAQTNEHGSDPDRLGQILSSAASAVTVEPLHRCNLSFDCSTINVGPMTFINATYEGSMQNTRHAEGDKLLVILPREGIANVRNTREGFISAPGRGIIMDSAHNTGFDIAERRSHLTVILEHAELQRRLSVLLETSIGDKLAFHPEIDLTTGPGLMLTQLASLICTNVANNPTLAPNVLANLSDAFFNLAICSLPHSLTDRMLGGASTALPRHVKRAIEFMRAHLADGITLEQVVAASGVSARALQQGFQQFKSTSPMRYLRDLRLDAVHNELLYGSGVRTVSQVALAWRFVQLGRFAAEYYARFGERPSQTLAARR